MRSLIFLCCFFAVVNLHAQNNVAGTGITRDSGYLTSFDGVKIYYEMAGTGSPVLLLHGFTGTGTSWKRTALFNDLISAGYQVIIPDMRGNGRSDKPHDSIAYDNDAEAKDLMLLMDKLKFKHYDVAGYSRGSIIVARLLVLDKRINKAVMGGMGADFTNPLWPRRIKFYRALMGDSVPELKPMVMNVQKQKLDQLALAYQQRSQPSTSKEALGKIQKPVLVICGSEDEDNGSASILAGLLPKSKVATVPGDHGHAFVTPEFAAAVIGFLKTDSK